jgi:hypothetical protein
LIYLIDFRQEKVREIMENKRLEVFRTFHPIPIIVFELLDIIFLAPSRCEIVEKRGISVSML